MTFASVYEMFDPLTTVRKQRFWDWFSGNAVRNIWTANATGASTATIDDTVGGGLLLTTGSTNGNRLELTFGDIKPFSHTGSVALGIMKLSTTSSIASRIGFISGLLVGDTSHSWITFDTALSATNYVFSTLDTSVSDTTGSVAADTNPHSFKIENTGSNSKSYIDGVLDVTKTTSLPDEQMEPHLSTQAKSAASRTGNFRYYEAYNT